MPVAAANLLPPARQCFAGRRSGRRGRASSAVLGLGRGRTAQAARSTPRHPHTGVDSSPPNADWFASATPGHFVPARERTHPLAGRASIPARCRHPTWPENTVCPATAHGATGSANVTTAHACAGVWGLRSSVLLSSRRVSVLRAAASEKCTDESARQRDQANRARHRCRGSLHVATENITPTTNTVNGGVANTPSVLQQARAVYGRVCMVRSGWRAWPRLRSLRHLTVPPIRRSNPRLAD